MVRSVCCGQAHTQGVEQKEDGTNGPGFLAAIDVRNLFLRDAQRTSDLSLRQALTQPCRIHEAADVSAGANGAMPVRYRIGDEVSIHATGYV